MNSISSITKLISDSSFSQGTNNGDTAEIIIETISKFSSETISTISQMIGIDDFSLYDYLKAYKKFIISFSEEISFYSSIALDKLLHILVNVLNKVLVSLSVAANSVPIIGQICSIILIMINFIITLFSGLGISFATFILAFIIYFYILFRLGVPFIYAYLGFVSIKLFYVILILISPFFIFILSSILSVLKKVTGKVIRFGKNSLIIIIWTAVILMISSYIILNVLSYIDDLRKDSNNDDRDDEGDGDDDDDDDDNEGEGNNDGDDN